MGNSHSTLLADNKTNLVGLFCHQFLWQRPRSGYRVRGNFLYSINYGMDNGVNININHSPYFPPHGTLCLHRAATVPLLNTTSQTGSWYNRTSSGASGAIKSVQFGVQQGLFSSDLYRKRRHSSRLLPDVGGVRGSVILNCEPGYQ